MHLRFTIQYLAANIVYPKTRIDHTGHHYLELGLTEFRMHLHHCNYRSKKTTIDFLYCKTCNSVHRTPWRNGSASDSRSEGCVFESRRGHQVFVFILPEKENICFNYK